MTSPKTATTSSSISAEWSSNHAGQAPPPAPDTVATTPHDAYRSYL